MKHLQWFAVFAFMTTQLVGCYTPPTPPPIVIGHITDKLREGKTSDAAEQAIRLALRELDKDETLTKAFGGRSVQVRHTDTRGVLDAFESQAVRLVSINRAVALLGGVTPRETTALDQTQVPLLTFHGYQASNLGKQVFYLGISPAKQGEVLAAHLADHPKIYRVAILSDSRRPESALLVETFEKALTETRKQADAKAASILTLRFGKDTKWAEFMKRIDAHAPQSILFAGAVEDFNAWYKAYRNEFFVSQPMLLYGGEDGAARSFEPHPDFPAKIVLATAFLPDAAFEKTQTFVKAYHDAFQSEPDVQAALAYDGFRMLIDAMRRAHPQLTPDRIREELQKTEKFEGITGPLTVKEQLVRRTVFLASWQDGTLTHVKTFAEP